jgi:hypothetical protein
MSLGQKTRWRILNRDNFTCQYCGRRAPHVTLEVDHIVPQSKGGTDDDANLTTACTACNGGKSADFVSVPGSDVHMDTTYLEKKGYRPLPAYAEAISVRAAIIDHITMDCIRAWPVFATREAQWPEVYDMLRLVEVFTIQPVMYVFSALEREVVDTGEGLPTVAEVLRMAQQRLAEKYPLYVELAHRDGRPIDGLD